jgi:PIN domain nuclease of toxin-antitoxin system
MKGLLDTHAFIWWDSQSSKLPVEARAFIQDPANTILLSAASIWEMVIKIQAGKIHFQTSLHTTLAQQQLAGLQLLSISPPHALALEQLPSLHRDPFDRLLIAQAIVEQAVLITSDSVVASYPVQVLW